VIEKPPIDGMWVRKGSSHSQRRPEALTRLSSVSVTATVLNEVDDIDRLVSSLMDQSLSPTEVIIVDGGSSDGTWERLRTAASKYPNLIAIQDESCSLKRSPGPIGRGRNIAIAKASSDVIACVDAGCTYDSQWLARLTAPILNGRAQYAVGGSCIDPQERTTWDVASAPFFGIKLSPDGPTKSCTARSMAFRKGLWEQVGGFPEDVFLGEDTIFDLRARKTTMPAFPGRAKAHYRPQHTFGSAVRQVASYAETDGVLGTRPARLFRNLARCVAEVASLALLPWSVIPLLCVLALEIYFAFRLDWRSFPGKSSPRLLGARLLFSLMVPWVVTWNHIAGMMTKSNQPNRQNVS
jgi:glycosyltransferase involved in cell wall biosynthesis